MASACVEEQNQKMKTAHSLQMRALSRAPPHVNANSADDSEENSTKAT
jgi:hypothetical protein